MTKFNFTPQSKFEDFLATKEMSKEAFDKLEVEKQAGLFNEYNEGVRNAINKAIEDKADASLIEAMQKELAELKEGQMVQMNKALELQGLAIKRIQDKELENLDGKNSNKSLRDLLKENAAKLKGLKEGGKEQVKNSEFDITVKAAGTMLPSNVSGGNVPVEDRLEGFNTVASRQVRLLDIMSPRSTSSNIVSWVYQANKDGSAGQTAAGAAKNQIDYDIVVASQSIRKSTAYIKVATEMIDDIDWIESEIKNELLRELLKNVESQAYSGDNSGQNLNGVYTTATTFAAGSFAGTVPNANEVDVLEVALNQIEIAEQGVPTAIMMHPSDLTSLRLLKVSATDKRYVFENGKSFINGVPIIRTTLVTQGTFLVGNFEKALLIQKEGIRIDMGLDADDFTKNLRTILAEWRGLVIVKNNDRTAFVKGSFATAKTALLPT